MPQAELSAGGIRVFAAGAAEHRLDAVLHEDVEEHHHRRFGRRLEVGTVLDGRKGDEVHLGHRHAADLGRELFRAGARVVDAPDDRVLEGDDALGGVGVVRTRRQQLVDRPALVDGHQLGPQLVVWRVKRDGELKLDAFGGELLEARDDAAGRKGDVAGAEVRTPAGVDELQCAERLVVVGEGLAHAHHDDVGDFAEGASRHVLGDDFVRRQRADDAARTAGAERAAHRAADLGGNALGEAPGRRNEHGLDGIAVLKADQELLGSVRRLGDVEDLVFRNRELGFQRLAEVLGERGRGVPVGDVVAVEGLQNLVCPKRPQTPVLQDRLPFVRQDAPRFRHGPILYQTLV